MKLKAIKDIVTPFGTLKKDSVVENTSTDVNKITFKPSSSKITIDLPKEFKQDFETVSSDTPISSSFESSNLMEDVVEGVSYLTKSIKIGGGIGLLGGLLLANYRKSGFIGYLGWGLTLGTVGVLAGTIIGAKKGIKNELKKELLK